MWISEEFLCDICKKTITSLDNAFLVETRNTGARIVLTVTKFDPVSAQTIPATCGLLHLYPLIDRGMGAFG